ncbi:FAD dependent oxidoreductase, partial [Helicosporidium sp. ATCC 50920]
MRSFGVLSRLRGSLPHLRRASTDSSAAFSVDTVVVGAGVVGLAVARRLGAGGCEVLVLDRAGAVASEASSRNSEVIHAGIYYPKDSVKSRTCVRGASLLRAFCARRSVPHRLLGKLVVATSDSELDQLAAIRALGSEAGAELVALTAAEARSLEPELACRAALLSPRTGVLDAHALAQALAADVEAWGGTIALGSRVTDLRLGA